jgi:hypothetical protein
MTMNDQTLSALTDILKGFEQLENVNLVGNTKLGLVGTRGHGAISDFIRQVGRKCKVWHDRYIASEFRGTEPHM